MCSSRYVGAALGLTILVMALACNRAEPPLTPEAAKAKGDAMLKQMSQTLASAQSFSYRTEQVNDRVKRTNEKVTERFERNTTVRRPNQIAFTDTGQDHNASGWYDGKHLTIVSNKEKVWVRGPMPATLDEALDYISAEYAVQIPTADLLYSNPYDALMTADTTGGWVKVDKVGERTCEHLSYQQSVVDWQIWLTEDDRRLPCQFQVTYKQEPGQPVMRITFFDWNTSPSIPDATFTPTIPDGYNRIKIMRHATVVDETVAKEEGGKK
jgi:hypothetical protein